MKKSLVATLMLALALSLTTPAFAAHKKHHKHHKRHHVAKKHTRTATQHTRPTTQTAAPAPAK